MRFVNFCPERQETLFSGQIFTDDLTLNEECHNMFIQERQNNARNVLRFHSSTSFCIDWLFCDKTLVSIRDLNMNFLYLWHDFSHGFVKKCKSTFIEIIL